MAGTSSVIMITALMVLYAALVWVAARRPDLEADKPNDKEVVIPTAATLKAMTKKKAPARSASMPFSN
ncbi:MAG TPA: hypothetical protein PKN33_20715, partial [Phycisphaerae bacterium]|nr:hypothetical protein [Phycisphaerae bacterium]